MKTIIVAIALLFSAVSFAGQDPLDLVGDRCAPGDVLFYSQNDKHTKEVLVCQWNSNIFYSFGKIGQEPELRVKVDASEVNLFSENNSSFDSVYLTIPNGNISYQISRETDKMINQDMYLLTVIKKGKGKLAEILLSNKVSVDGIESFTK